MNEAKLRALITVWRISGGSEDAALQQAADMLEALLDGQPVESRYMPSNRSHDDFIAYYDAMNLINACEHQWITATEWRDPQHGPARELNCQKCRLRQTVFLYLPRSG